MSAALRSAVRALRDFLRGFVGATSYAHDAHAVRAALAKRAERRRGCC
ncbi:MAG TPA: hypothetical protein VFT98_06020 [Myxococcota bacterium]|nr:hypothetical protein [Myxococcota bacterium]